MGSPEQAGVWDLPGDLLRPSLFPGTQVTAASLREKTRPCTQEMHGKGGQWGQDLGTQRLLEGVPSRSVAPGDKAGDCSQIQLVAWAWCGQDRARAGRLCHLWVHSLLSAPTLGQLAGHGPQAAAPAGAACPWCWPLGHQATCEAACRTQRPPPHRGGSRPLPSGQSQLEIHLVVDPSGQFMTIATT